MKNHLESTNSKSTFLTTLKQIFAPSEHNRPTHRVVHIEQNKTGDYQATVQVIGKGSTFKIKPETILADDRMTNQFSPCDIRTLTYLGYLGINSPKYKILARQLSETSDKMIFSIQKKGSDEVSNKTADEISTDAEILKSLDQKDAHDVGYARATEQNLAEEKQKLLLRKQAALPNKTKSASKPIQKPSKKV